VTRLWIDTDIGDDPDDTVALWCAANMPGVELVGVSTVDGDMERRASIVRELLPGVDVCAGAPEPARLDMVDVLVGIGPWTNVARISVAGALPRRVVLMGGALGRVVHHDTVRTVEHNVARDPAAAGRLLATTAYVVIVPLDATASLTTDDETERRLVRAIPMLESQLAEWRSRHGRHVQLVLHDPAAVLIALGEPIAELQRHQLRVVPDGAMRPSMSAPEHNVVAHIDGDALRARVRALM
jgi:purine nucleosidase